MSNLDWVDNMVESWTERMFEAAHPPEEDEDEEEAEEEMRDKLRLISFSSSQFIDF